MITFDCINRTNRRLGSLIEIIVGIILTIGLILIDIRWELTNFLGNVRFLEPFARFFQALLIVVITPFFLSFIYKKVEKKFPLMLGKIQLSSDRIVITTNRKREEIFITQIDKLFLFKDVPFAGDDRSIYEKASKLEFSVGKKKYMYELNIPEKDFNELRPILSDWKKGIKNYTQI